MSLGSKLFMGFVVLVAAWNLSKLPFYMAFNNDQNDSYDKSTGTAMSINLGHMIEGYKGRKMRTPAMNFMALHCTLGITILGMAVVAMTNKMYRKTYGKVFFLITIVHGIHTLPASVINDSTFLVVLFAAACIIEALLSVWGLNVLGSYDKDPAGSDQKLHMQYLGITCINAAAAVLEAPQINKALAFNRKNGYFQTYFDDKHHPRFGTTIYDLLPEKVGFGLTIAAICGFWIVWPIMLVSIDSVKKSKKA